MKFRLGIDGVRLLVLGCSFWRGCSRIGIGLFSFSIFLLDLPLGCLMGGWGVWALVVLLFLGVVMFLAFYCPTFFLNLRLLRQTFGSCLFLFISSLLPFTVFRSFLWAHLELEVLHHLYEACWSLYHWKNCEISVFQGRSHLLMDRLQDESLDLVIVIYQ